MFFSVEIGITGLLFEYGYQLFKNGHIILKKDLKIPRDEIGTECADKI